MSPSGPRVLAAAARVTRRTSSENGLRMRRHDGRPVDVPGRGVEAGRGKGSGMKGGTQAAVAIGVGYLLGRRRKLRRATLVAAAVASGGFGGLGSAALRRGAKLLSQTEMISKVAPQLGEITETVRSDLIGAGKAAATAAVSN